MILYECYEKVRKAQQDKPDTAKQEEKKRIEAENILPKTQDVSQMTISRAEKLIANMAEVIREMRQDIYNQDFAEFLIKETGITPEELEECGIMQKEAIIDD